MSTQEDGRVAVLDVRHIQYRPDKELNGVKFLVLDRDRKEKGRGVLSLYNDKEAHIRIEDIDSPVMVGDLAAPDTPEVSPLESIIADILLNSER
jgi:hypothetical protein